jgi:hypothetical protein
MIKTTLHFVPVTKLGFAVAISDAKGKENLEKLKMKSNTTNKKITK